MLYKIIYKGHDEFDLSDVELLGAIKTIASYMKIWPDLDIDNGYSYSFCLSHFVSVSKVNNIKMDEKLKALVSSVLEIEEKEKEN